MTNPLRGLGSNQVVFGGIIMSASATPISSSIVQGYIAIAHTQSSKQRRSNSLCPRIPPTKSMRESFFRSVMPRMGPKTLSVRICESSYEIGVLVSRLEALRTMLCHVPSISRVKW